jgi:hypothetical protein
MDAAGVYWRANYGEISEILQFRVGPVGSSFWTETFPANQLTDLITILNGTGAAAVGQVVTGTYLQARRIGGTNDTVSIEPLSPFFPPYLMQLRNIERPDLISVLVTLQAMIAEEGSEPDDWDGNEPADIPMEAIPNYLHPEQLSATFARTAGAAQSVNAQTTFTSQQGLRSSTWFGLGAGVGSARNPFYLNTIVDGASILDTLAAGGGDDYVGVQMNVKFSGGFAARKTTVTGSISASSTTLTLTSGTFTSPIIVGYTVYIPGAGVGGGLPLKAKIASITDSTHAVLTTAASTTVTGVSIICTLAADHNFLFAANDFFTTGTAAGDLSGIDNVYGRLMELHIYTPDVTLGTVKATSSEMAIEASATGATIGTAMGHHVKAIVNRSGATITNAYGLYVEAAGAGTATNSYALYVADGGKTRIGGATVIHGYDAADVSLVLQTPLGAGSGAKAFEIRDITLTNRTFSIATNGAMGSSSFVTAFEGLSSSVMIGSVTGGFAGVRFGSAGVEFRQHTTGGMQVYNGKTFVVPAITTATRLSAANATAGGLYWDTTLGKLVVSDGTNWKDMAGTTV